MSCFGNPRRQGFLSKPAGTRRPIHGRPLPLVFIFAFFLSVSLFPTHSSALETLHKIRQNKRRWTLLESFVFGTGGGVLQVRTANVFVFTPSGYPLESPFIGVVLADVAASGLIQRLRSSALDSNASLSNDATSAALPSTCPFFLSNSSSDSLRTVLDLASPDPDRQSNTSVSLNSTGPFSLFLVNCAPLSLVSADISVTMYNIGEDGEKLFLSAYQVLVAPFAFGLAALYIVLLSLWLYHVSKVWCRTIPPPLFLLLLTSCLPLLALTSALEGAALLKRQTSGASLALDWGLDSLILASAAALVASFIAGLEQVDPYLTTIERWLLYFSVPTWMMCKTALALSQNAAFLPWLISRDSDTWIGAQAVIRSAVEPAALLILAILFCFEAFAFLCSQLLTKRRGRIRDDREEEGLFSKYYIILSLVVVSADQTCRLLPRALPFYLLWLPNVVGQLVLWGFLSYTFYRVRPSLERSLYQLFDENDDDLDAELDEI